MRTRLLLQVIVASATAFSGASSAQSPPFDAQAQAGALLKRPHISAPGKPQPYTRSSSAVIDVHASAAALLTGRTSGSLANSSDRVASALASKSLDAHAHAARLLRGSAIPVDEDLRSTQISKPLEEHPAVRVAQTWSARGIDPNAFIVAHPARLQLRAASSTESPPSAAIVAGVRSSGLATKLTK